MKKVPLIGPHVSIAGGVHRAVETGHSIGATTIQIFTANQRTWTTKPISDDEVKLFKEAVKRAGLKKIMSHASYLLNLGSPHVEVREKSIQALREEIERCELLGLTFLNFHPGSALDGPVERCLKNIAYALLSVADCFNNVTILVETMAGRGNIVGAHFEELTYIIERVKGKVPIGVCLDTCDSFAAGYDLRTEKAVAETLDAFDEVVGIKYLKALHLNDSQYGLGQRRDRHSPIGEGEIGKSGFSAIMKEPRLFDLPKYLETPGGLDVWKREIAWLKKQIP